MCHPRGALAFLPPPSCSAYAGKHCRVPRREYVHLQRRAVCKTTPLVCVVRSGHLSIAHSSRRRWPLRLARPSLGLPFVLRLGVVWRRWFRNLVRQPASPLPGRCARQTPAPQLEKLRTEVNFCFLAWLVTVFTAH